MIGSVIVAISGAGVTAVLVRAARRAGAGHRVRDLTPASRWHLPGVARRWLERALADSGLDVEPEAACEIAGIAVVSVTMLTFAVSPGLVPVVTGLMIAAGPLGLRAARRRAERRFVAGLPGCLEHVAAALRGGAGMSDALEAAAPPDGPLALDLRRVRARAALGIGLAASLATWPRERPLPSVRAAAGSLAVASTVGGPAADALDGLSVSLRERLGAVAEARALSAQSRLSALVVGGAPIAYLAFSAVLDPASVDTLVTTDFGRVCLLVGVGCELLAALWMRAILASGADE
jgi:tight adherence protein B